MSEFQSSALPEQRSSDPSHRQQRHSLLRWLALSSCAALLMALALSLAGCATQATPPCEPLPVTPMPALSEPLPQQSYSTSVQQSINRWVSALTGTFPTSKP